MSSSDRRRARLGETEMAHFALFDQIAHRSGYVLDGDIRINTMLIEQIDRLETQALERSICNCADVLGATVDSGRRHRAPRLDFQPEFRGNHDGVAERRNALAELSLVT